MNDQPTAKTVLTQFLEDALIPATTEPFFVRNQFKTGAGVKFATIWGDFKAHFLVKIENPRPAVKLRKYKLLAFAPDGPIIAELGGETRVECTLSAAFALLLRQPGGQPGFLQTNGFANIFYARNDQGVLCAVRIGLADDGWVVDAIPVADPLAWNGKHEIFCPAPDVLS
jgi:hypothetical protein